MKNRKRTDTKRAKLRKAWAKFWEALAELTEGGRIRWNRAGVGDPARLSIMVEGRPVDCKNVLATGRLGCMMRSFSLLKRKVLITYRAGASGPQDESTSTR